jgi:hypothetical protein
MVRSFVTIIFTEPKWTDMHDLNTANTWLQFTWHVADIDGVLSQNYPGFQSLRQ